MFRMQNKFILIIFWEILANTNDFLSRGARPCEVGGPSRSLYLHPRKIYCFKCVVFVLIFLLESWANRQGQQISDDKNKSKAQMNFFFSSEFHFCFFASDSQTSAPGELLGPGVGLTLGPSSPSPPPIPSLGPRSSLTYWAPTFWEQTVFSPSNYS